jgi:hypothetical protein
LREHENERDALTVSIYAEAASASGRKLLPGRPDNLADPFTCLFIKGSGHVGSPGRPVRLYLLEDHRAEAREDGGGEDGQQDGF